MKQLHVKGIALTDNELGLMYTSGEIRGVRIKPVRQIQRRDDEIVHWPKATGISRFETVKSPQLSMDRNSHKFPCHPLSSFRPSTNPTFKLCTPTLASQYVIIMSAKKNNLNFVPGLQQ